MLSFIHKLQTDAWRTSGARYNASRRLRRRELFSTVSLALFSAMSVGLAFIQRLYAAGGTPLDNYLTAFSACLGVLLLSISLMEWGAANGAKAELLHRNAEDLNSFQRKIELKLAGGAGVSAQFTVEQADELRQEYELIKSQCPHNHAPIDEELFRASKRFAREFLDSSGQPRYTWASTFVVQLRWYTHSVWYFCLFWLLILLAAGAAFFFSGTPTPKV